MSTFDDRANSYDANARTVMPGYEALHEMARATLKAYLQADAKVLLLGIGTGYEAEQLPQSWRLVGVDPSGPMLKKARERLGDRVDLREGILEDFPELIEFDAALSVGVLHHVQDGERLVAETSRRLKKSALLVLGSHVGPMRADAAATKALETYWGLPPEEAAERTRFCYSHIRAPDLSDLEMWFRAAGLSDLEPLFRIAYFQLFAAFKSS